ncbi:MAG: hypothetical protein WEF50_10605 [Myxococcota bacterium]
MKAYQSFATTLDELLRADQAVRLTVEGYMPLSVERIGNSGDGRPLVAISQTAVQNGDLMRDPELVFEIFALFAEPITFRNDYVGILQDVYDYDDHGRRTHLRPRLKAELKAFARIWFRNLRHQGFLGHAARREVLS